jgi:hypothetical protein
MPLLLDIRGNRGGEGDFAIGLEKVLKQKTQALAAVSDIDKFSIVSVASFMNTFFRKWAQAETAEERQYASDSFFGIRNSVYKYIAENLSFSDILNQENQSEQKFGSRSVAYRHPVGILLDKGCASACETIIDTLKGWPNTHLMGMPSYGALHISNAGLIYLPHSKIEVHLGMKRFVYDPTIDALEAEGHRPEMLILEQDWAASADSAAQYLKNLGTVIGG